MSQNETRVAKKQNLQGKVLLVEDDETLGFWLQQKLQEAGLDCHWEEAFEGAWAEFQKVSYHAVITDVFLSPTPKAEGLELIRRIEPAGVPVVVISSAADLKVAKEALNHGAFYLLEKPFEADNLVQVLQKAWEEPRGLQAMMERFMDLYQLTPKEKEIVRLLLKGLSNKEIASVGDNSDRTIKFHLTSIFEKTGVKSRTELISAILPT